MSIPNQNSRFVEIENKAAILGDPDCQACVGSYFLARNPNEAYYWLSRSAEQDNPRGLYYLGQLFLSGAFHASTSSHSSDPIEIAIKFLGKSAQKGEARAMYKLSRLVHLILFFCFSKEFQFFAEMLFFLILKLVY